MSELHQALQLSYTHDAALVNEPNENGEAMGTRRRGLVARLGAADVMQKADADGNGGVDIGEFHALFSPPEGIHLSTVCV